ncbi:hypothetical protein, partial [Clostridium sp. AF32-12BH]|uniref:hypothetical protein n=1 Tax=Clostridium sp. AF32-12BH TaxID=2292006 RepID=UPI000FF5D094
DSLAQLQAFVNNFLNFFLNPFRFALLFSAACYILSDVFAFVNNFFYFSFQTFLSFREKKNHLE